MRRAVGTAVIADIVVAVGTVVTLAIVSRRYSPSDFGLYTVATRIVGLVQAPLLIGIAMSLPRRLPATRSTANASTLVSSALGLVLISCTAVVACALLFPDPLAHAAFGSPGLTHELLGLSLFITGSVLHVFAFATLRGMLKFTAASSLLALNIGIVPLVAALANRGTATLLVTVGTCWSLTSLASVSSFIVPRQISPALVLDLVRVGWRRVPGDCALFALPALPPLYVLHTSGSVNAGIVSLAVSMVTLSGTLFTPISAVLTPQLSHWQDNDQGRHVVSVFAKTRLLIMATIAIPIIGWPLVPILIPSVFGEASVAAVPYVRIALLAAPAYATYVLLRSFLDGLSDRPTTSYLAVVALASTCVVLALGGNASISRIEVGMISMVVGFWTLGTLTYIFVSRRLHTLVDGV